MSKCGECGVPLRNPNKCPCGWKRPVYRRPYTPQPDVKLAGWRENLMKDWYIENNMCQDLGESTHDYALRCRAYLKQRGLGTRFV